MESRKTKLTDVNPHLVCVLCHGYFVDATTIAECLHSFCRSCIFRHLERKSICPICEVQVHNTKLHLYLRPDKTLQDIVYKLVPGLFHNEMQRRRDFYKNHPFRDEHLEPECRGVGLDRLIYSPDNIICISLEFYDEDREREEWNNNNVDLKPVKQPPSGTKRYLECPAGFKMAHLKKFIREKYGLSPTCRVEIIYRKIALPDSYSLMDVAYIYAWKRNEPMRFYYQLPDVIHKQIEPTPPAIVETAVEKLSNGQLETEKVEENNVVPLKEEVPPVVVSKPQLNPEPRPATPIVNGVIHDEPPASFDFKSKSETEEKKVEEEEKKVGAVTQQEVVPKPVPPIDSTLRVPPPTAAPPPMPNTPSTEQQKNVIIPNGFVTSRPLSKQDELSVSVLLSLGNCRPGGIKKSEPVKIEPKKVTTPRAIAPKPYPFSVDHVMSPKTNGKLVKRHSVNKIASELAENSRLNKEVKKTAAQSPANLGSPAQPPQPQQTVDPFAFQTSEITPNLTNSSPSQPQPSPRSHTPQSMPPPIVPVDPTKSVGSPVNGTMGKDRPEVTLKTSNGSITISTKPGGRKSPLSPPKNPTGLRLNGTGLTVTPEDKKHNGPQIHQSNINNRLPTFNKPNPRKAHSIVPGGVMSKTGPTLDQRLQQLYKSNSRQVAAAQQVPLKPNSPPSTKHTESRLAIWLNNRLPGTPRSMGPISEKSPVKGSNEDKVVKEPTNESETAKVGKEMVMLKRKLEELRKNQAGCEITQENPSPDLAKKLRDVTPDVSIELMRAGDMRREPKVKEKGVKRPVPGLKSIQDMDLKKKGQEEEKPSKKPKLSGKCDDALDLSGTTNKAEDLTSRMAMLQQSGIPQQQLHWLVNRPPLLANQHFIPRSN